MEKVIIGIDVSKAKLDLCICIGDVMSQELELPNIISDLDRFFKDFLKKHSKADILICCEYTSHYIYPLSFVCADLDLPLWLEDPYRLKHSSGLHRGKNDKMDARKIADYCNRFQDRVRLYSLPDKTIVSLRALISERDMFISDKGKYQGQLTDQKDFMNKADYAEKRERLEGLIKYFEASILAIDKKIEKLIASDATLSIQHRLLCSIDGIGTVIATKMIVMTNAFKNFNDARKFCCYAGVAPFEYRSGSSVYSKSKVSHRADKTIKSLLHMAALTAATRMKNSDLREYYERKVAEGKNKRAVLNAIRAKLILRMFAVIKNNRPYQKIYNIEVA
jgi:transposase